MGERSRRPWAVGYVSAPGTVAPGMWTRWHAQVEAQALWQGLPMLHVYSDEHTGQDAVRDKSARGGNPVGTADRSDGLARMIGEIRELAHLRSGYVSVLIVPTLAHLSPARDGSEQSVAMLLGLHLGLTVQAVECAEFAQSPQIDDSVRVPPPPRLYPREREWPDVVLLPDAAQMPCSRPGGHGQRLICDQPHGYHPAPEDFNDLVLGIRDDYSVTPPKQGVRDV